MLTPARILFAVALIVAVLWWRSRPAPTETAGNGAFDDETVLV